MLADIAGQAQGYCWQIYMPEDVGLILLRVAEFVCLNGIAGAVPFIPAPQNGRSSEQEQSTAPEPEHSKRAAASPHCGVMGVNWTSSSHTLPAI